jgi:tetratricopeptide (TPR) repeat protein
MLDFRSAFFAVAVLTSSALPAHAVPARPAVAIAKAHRGAFSNADDLAKPPSGTPLEAKQVAEAPFGLTSPDGEGLELRQVEARVAIDGPLAWTELWLTFHNPENRVREGRFAITLPSDASLGRFAMKIGEHWMDGEVVEKHAAEVAYEDFLHARQDPAILTKDAGNVFSARVFPIGAKADKQLVIAWAQTLADPNQPYLLPLRGLPLVPALAIRAWQHQPEGPPKVLVSATLAHVQPQRDLHIAVPPLSPQDMGGRRDGAVAVGRMTVEHADAEARFAEVLVLFDTSASAAPAFEQRLQSLREVVSLAGHYGATAVKVVAFDQQQSVVFAGDPAAFGAKELAALRKRGALGASDLGAALRFARAHSTGPTRAVLLSDCVATMGPTEPAELTKLAALLGKAKVQRLDVVMPAGARNDAVGRALASAGLAQPGAALAGDDPPLFRLTRTVLPRVQVAVPGAKWVWPQTVDALQAGDTLVIAAELPANAPFVVRLSGGMEGEVALATQAGTPALVGRLGAAAQVALLEARHAVAAEKDKAALAKELVDVSVRNRVLSDLTAFLVLETEGDYARYKIDRDKPAALLAIAASGDVQGGKRGDPAVALAEIKGVGQVRAEVRYGTASGGGASQGERSSLPEEESRSIVEQSKAPASAPQLDVHSSLPGAAESATPAPSKGFGIRECGSTKDYFDPPNRYKVTSGLLQGEGETKSAVARAVAGKSGALLRCLYRAREEDPDTGGKVKVEFTVGTARAFAAVSVSGVSGKFAECIHSKLMSIRGLPALTAPEFFTQFYWFGPREPTIAEMAKDLRDEKKFDRQIARAKAAEERERLFAERNPVAEARRFHRAVEAETARTNAAYLARLRGIRGLDGALKTCFQHERARTGAEVATRFAYSFAGGRSTAGETPPSLTSAGTLGLCLDAVLHRLRGVPVAEELVSVDLAYRLRGDKFEAYPSPAAVATRFAREKTERRRAFRADARAEALGQTGTCTLGPLSRNPEAALAEAAVPDFDQEPDPSVVRYWKLHRQLANPATATTAWQWHLDAPGEVLPLVLYGQALARSDPHQAARAFGSLIDLHPARADLRRYAGNLLESVGPAGQIAALDTYAKAVKLRPDHVSGYPQYAWALVRAGKFDTALTQLEAALVAEHRGDASRLAPAVAKDAMGLVAAAWLAQDSSPTAAVLDRLTKVGAKLPKGPALRFLLTWETDNSNVDLHVRDGKGAQSCYSSPKLPSGGELYENVTTGYGPEWYAIDAPKAFPYKLFAHYYARGPMGFGMGRVLVLRWDGKRMSFADHPFVVTADDQAVAIGVVR